MAKELTVTEAARNFSDVVNRVFYRGEEMDLTRGGRVVARLVPPAPMEVPKGESFLKAWKAIPHLTRREAEAFAEEIEMGREQFNQEPDSQRD